MKFQLFFLLAIVAIAFAAPAEDRQKRSYYYAPAYYYPSSVAYASNIVGFPGFASRYSSLPYYSAPLYYYR